MFEKWNSYTRAACAENSRGFDVLIEDGTIRMVCKAKFAWRLRTSDSRNSLCISIDCFPHLSKDSRCYFIEQSCQFRFFQKWASAISIERISTIALIQMEAYPTKERERERERERGGGRAKRLLTRDAFFSFAKSLCVSHGYEQSPDALTMPLIDPHATHKTRTYYSPLRDRKSSALAA